MSASTLKNLSIAATLEKYLLSSGQAWFALVDITWPDGSHLQLVRNSEDVSYDALDGRGPQIYTGFAWEFDALEEKSDGSLPKWALRCSNISRVVESLINQYSGGIGARVAIYVVNSARLKREPDIELYWQIVESYSDSKWVHFTLGAPSPFRILHPRHVYTENRCIVVYRSVECGYSGGLPSCSYRLDGSNGCRAHSNQQRFMGFPGIDSNGIAAVTVR